MQTSATTYAEPPTFVVAKKTSAISEAGLVHEIRNPLTNISLAGEMLKGNITDKLQLVYVDMILRAAQKINNLVIELVHHHEVPVERSSTHSVHNLLDEVVEMAQDRIRLNNIILRKNFQETDYNIECSKAALTIAFTNIVINALDSMSEKGGELRLQTKSVLNSFIVSIEDTGCGISNKNISKICKPYFTQKPGGLGIGLSTTYDILKANKIKLHVSSELGVGTKFMLIFE